MTNCLTAEISKIIENSQNIPKKKYAMGDVLDPSKTRTTPAPIHATRTRRNGFLLKDI
jgi:hypothetical protein